MPLTAMVLDAEIEVNRPVRRSTVREMSVTSRPKAPALVTTEFAPEELGSEHVYQVWVWPETTSPYSGRRPATIGAMSPVNPLQAFGSGGGEDACPPPWWMTSTREWMPTRPR